uniref:Ig-like domain-containing protein n=1 Tax=Lates calcarifer TaxID=8187 RepID=A0A4W6CM68_LATCA
MNISKSHLKQLQEILMSSFHCNLVFDRQNDESVDQEKNQQIDKKSQVGLLQPAEGSSVSVSVLKSTQQLQLQLQRQSAAAALSERTRTDTFNSRQVFVSVSLTVGNWVWIFGSGTKLYVTDKDIVKPVVSVYPAASRAHLGGKTSLLCLASGMFPPLVQFSWKRQEEDGNLVDVSSLGLHISLFTFCSSLKDFNIHSLILLECPTAQQIPITQLSLHRSD